MATARGMFFSVRDSGGVVETGCEVDLAAMRIVSFDGPVGGLSGDGDAIERIVDEYVAIDGKRYSAANTAFETEPHPDEYGNGVLLYCDDLAG